MSPKSARLIRRVCAGLLLLGIVAFAEPCAAQYRWPSMPYRGPRTPLNNAAHNAFKSNLDSAKNFLDAANKRLADLRPKHQQAEAEFKKEQREYRQARDAAKRQFEEAPELVRAREKHAEAKKAYDEQHHRVRIGRSTALPQPVSGCRSPPEHSEGGDRQPDGVLTGLGCSRKPLLNRRFSWSAQSAAQCLR